MSVNIQQRNFLRLYDFSGKEIRNLLDLARELKLARREGDEMKMLTGKNIVIMFETASLHSRYMMELAAMEQGLGVSVMDLSASPLGYGESLKDTAKVLGRMFHGIIYRGTKQTTVTSLAKYSGVPVLNAHTNECYPSQVLADLLTMQEHCDKPLRKISCCYLGDARGNIANTLVEASARIGFDLRIASPASMVPPQQLIDSAMEASKESHGKISVTESVQEAVKDVDFIYTDRWITMEIEKDIWADKIAVLKPYQLTMDILEMAKNPKVRFMHSLPANHNRDSEFGEFIFKKYGMNAMEVTNEVFDSPASIVFDQAENRLHTFKAIMIATLGE